MAQARRRKRQQEESVTTIDGNNIRLGIGAIILLIAVGALAFWLAGRDSGPEASQPVAQLQPRGQAAPQPQPVVPQSQPQTSSRSQPAPQSHAKSQSQIPSSSSRSSNDPGGLSVGLASDPAKDQAAPDFSVKTLDGSIFTLTEHKGEPIVMFFMAYWCGTYVPEARDLKRIHEEYGDQVTIVALDVDPSSTPEGLRRFMEFAGNPDYIWAFDGDNAVAQKYKVRSLDTTIIIDADGNIVYRDGYPTPYKKLKAQLENIVS